MSTIEAILVGRERVKGHASKTKMEAAFARPHARFSVISVK